MAVCYYGARYLAPWLARWITPDAAGAGADLNLYVYVGNNPLKYRDPTGHMKKTRN
jgi:RHS repeat-associated protein